MKISKVLLTTAALVASFSASAGAQVTGQLGGGFGLFHPIVGDANNCTSLTCSVTGIGTIAGGHTYLADQQFADIPSAIIPGTRFLAAGPTATGPAILSVSPGLTYLSFLWGSPDTYNTLTITSTVGSYVFTAAGMAFAVTNGNQAFSQYVQFRTNTVGETITSLKFESPTQDAFEVTNFSTTTAPEPSTYALMGAGLLALAFASKRRKAA